MKPFPVRMLAFCALFAALTAICSQLAIPMAPVPINLALLAVELCAALLPCRYAVISMTVYILLGLVGVPVFSSMRSGPAALFGVTGGYIFGYVAAALVISLLAAKFGRGFWRLCLWMAIGVLACYAFGTAWFMILSKRTLAESLSLCVLPFLPGDALKILLAAVLAGRLEKPLRRIMSR